MGNNHDGRTPKNVRSAPRLLRERNFKQDSLKRIVWILRGSDEKDLVRDECLAEMRLDRDYDLHIVW